MGNILDMKLPFATLASFCCCDKYHLAARDNGVSFHLAVAHSPLLREVRVGTQAGAEAMEDAAC